MVHTINAVNHIKYTFQKCMNLDYLVAFLRPQRWLKLKANCHLAQQNTTYLTNSLFTTRLKNS